MPNGLRFTPPRNSINERLSIRTTLLCLLVSLAAWPASAQRTVILAGKLLDPVTGRTTSSQYITIESGRITSVGSLYRAVAGDSVVDLSRLTVLPGLIDAHVHLTIGGALRTTALANLHAGFTTVVDLGARGTRLLAFRDSVNAGAIAGPRILAAGMWVGKQGGVCEFNGLGIAGGVEAFRARVRENIRSGADLIKVCVSGWPAESFAHPDDYEIPDSTLAAVVGEARAAGRLVIAHDISRGGVQAAIRTRVNGLAHAAYLDSALARQLREQGMFIVPTLASLAGDTSAASRALVRATLLAYRNGVPLVFGTDGGVFPHEGKVLEFEAMHKAGIPLIDAIRSATAVAARALGIDSVGTIAPGKLADIIAVEGDPLTDPAALGRVRFVMVRGKVVGIPAAQKR